MAVGILFLIGYVLFTYVFKGNIFDKGLTDLTLES